MKFVYYLISYICVLLYANDAICQADSAVKGTRISLANLSDKMLQVVENKYSSVEKVLDKFSRKSLLRFQKKEANLRKNLQNKDSLASSSIFDNAQHQYGLLMAKIKKTSNDIDKSKLKEYIPRLDSIQSALGFIEKAGAKFADISPGKLEQIKAISKQLKSLQLSIQTSSDIGQFIKERKNLIKAQLDKYALGKELRQFDLQAYYYQQKYNEFKEIIADPKKLESKLLSVVRDFPAFKDFMAKNSQLSQLFRMPGNSSTQDLAPGLQSWENVQEQMNGRLGTQIDPQQYINQGAQQAQAEFAKLKDKLNKVGGGSSDMIMPDFKPNHQKTKSFWKRMEYGFNIQSQKATSILPAMSDLALSFGYKLNDKSTVGLGIGYKLGLGRNFRSIRLTSQGLSIRSFLDIKLKGSMWFSGGFEENYMHEFTKFDQLKNIDAWQKSGLIGLSKKYRLAKKTGSIQLLWDFLSYSQVPRTSHIKFRLGYSL